MGSRISASLCSILRLEGLSFAKIENRQTAKNINNILIFFIKSPIKLIYLEEASSMRRILRGLSPPVTFIYLCRTHEPVYINHCLRFWFQYHLRHLRLYE
ncbi:hypothetical protein E4N76_07880 [Treponema putidum]|uniref:Uncharacterized protein n=1 Tax=Treponema putidum TaxID=221027 RepID=A0AAE9MW00_9SPIR|nr:hypothetical protein E4N76_07880 [Treponema putidum]UTY31326.1 hypothetical protein E4N75_07280 [Treponema putidum]UTY33761.1 hypothetical protein E4N74_06910 [Treponema putidum]